MTTKVNGGIFPNQAAEGSLRFFQITGLTDIGTGYVGDGTTVYELPDGTQRVYGAGEPIPGSAMDILSRVLQERATILIMDNNGDEVNVCLATATAWGEDDAAGVTADLQAAIVALGNGPVVPGDASGAGAAAFDFTGAGVTETAFALNGAVAPTKVPFYNTLKD